MSRTAVAGAAMLAFLLVACGDSTGKRGSDTDADADADAENPTSSHRGPLPGDDLKDCVSEYLPRTLAQQQFAFDGEVVKVGEPVSDRGDTADLDQPGVTFRVRHWYAGGDEETVTVDMPVKPSWYGAIAYGVGSRLLISGQPRWGGHALKSPIAWGCGFSRYYDRATAAEWESTFSADR